MGSIETDDMINHLREPDELVRVPPIKLHGDVDGYVTKILCGVAPERILLILHFMK